jgi:hypothetical protein
MVQGIRQKLVLRCVLKLKGTTPENSVVTFICFFLVAFYEFSVVKNKLWDGTLN